MFKIELQVLFLWKSNFLRRIGFIWKINLGKAIQMTSVYV